MKGSATWALLLAASLCAACKDEAPKPTVAASSFKVDVDPGDYVKVGFGGDRAHGGAWDEVSVQGDGTVRWTHIDDKAAKTQAGFDKRGKLDAEKAAGWFQAVVDEGLYDHAPGDVSGDGIRMTLDANIDGKQIKVVKAGAPDTKLQSHLDELMASTLGSP